MKLDLTVRESEILKSVLENCAPKYQHDPNIYYFVKNLVKELKDMGQ